MVVKVQEYQFYNNQTGKRRIAGVAFDQNNRYLFSHIFRFLFPTTK